MRVPLERGHATPLRLCGGSNHALCLQAAGDDCEDGARVNHHMVVQPTEDTMLGMATPDPHE